MTDRSVARRPGRARAVLGAIAVHRGYPGLWLLAMLLTVLALAAAHIGHMTAGRPADWYWHLGNDRGYGELLGYLQAGWGAIFLIIAWWRMREAVLLAWAVVLGYYLLDDSMRFHEQYGWALARATGWYDRWGNSGGDLGEIAYMALVGLVLAAVVAVAHAFSGQPGRRVSWHLVMLFLVLVVVGIGVDVVHALIVHSAVLDLVFALLEEGGELLVLSVIVAYLLKVAHEAAPAAERVSTAAARRPSVEGARSPQH
ncbi:hypothetical protein [Georgenia wangjunii]|uniref:hypothetical protein n=1 Tax=Georgenia wangjunii TaxID=3117730 RepID=UPI002F26038F